MPPAVGMAIAGIAAAVGSTAAAKMGANASRRAGQVQADAADKTLAFQRTEADRAQKAKDDAVALERQQYGQAQQAYDAWLHGGATAKLGDILGIPAGMAGPSTPMPMPPNRMSPQSAQPTSTIDQLRGAPLEAPGPRPSGMTPGGMVTLQAPNGQTRQFAANDPRVERFLTMPDKNGQVAQRVA